MAYKIFLDANILLDFTLKRTAYIDCKKIIELAVNGQVQAYISPSIVHIVGYWLTKTYGADKAKGNYSVLKVAISFNAFKMF